MSEKKLSVNDLAIAESYVDVKQKLWAALKPVAESLKNKYPDGGDKSTYTTASTQEGRHARFVVSQFVDTKKQLQIFAGFCFPEGENAWVGSWIEIPPGEKDTSQSLRAGYAQSLNKDAEIFQKLPYDDEWHVYQHDNKAWLIASKGMPLVGYVSKEQAVVKITKYLEETVTKLIDKYPK